MEPEVISILALLGLIVSIWVVTIVAVKRMETQGRIDILEIQVSGLQKREAIRGYR